MPIDANKTTKQPKSESIKRPSLEEINNLTDSIIKKLNKNGFIKDEDTKKVLLRQTIIQAFVGLK